MDVALGCHGRLSSLACTALPQERCIMQELLLCTELHPLSQNGHDTNLSWRGSISIFRVDGLSIGTSVDTRRLPIGL